MTASASSPAGLASWVKPAVLEFKEAELLHLRRMPDSALMRLCSCSLEEVPQRRHAIRHYGDVAFCLAGTPQSSTAFCVAARPQVSPIIVPEAWEGLGTQCTPVDCCLC
jgi:hypothetical protein